MGEISWLAESLAQQMKLQLLMMVYDTQLNQGFFVHVQTMDTRPPFPSHVAWLLG